MNWWLKGPPPTMREFIALYQALDQTTSTRAKVSALEAYFRSAAPADLAWAVYFLSGRRLKRLVGAAALRSWLAEESELPAWLVEETYANVGDLAETIALLLADRVVANALAKQTLAEFVEDILLPLSGADEAVKRAVVTDFWQTLPYDACYVVNKLLTGALRVGVSQTLVATALAAVAALPRPVILHRLMGHWTADAEFAEQLLAPDDGKTDLSKPYPFYLASPLEARPGELAAADVTALLGAREAWQAEWKWDG
ncbi:MAG: ATP-dependent DNA ligase, partial [Pseudomonadota bacterium]